MVDVITSHHNPGITIRSFSDNPEKVSSLATAFIKGTQEAGVAAVAKHFPGKGAAEVDAHIDLPTVAVPRKTFETIHLFPFKKAAENGVKGIMSTHIYCPALDGRRLSPATFSPKIVRDYLRTRLHFEGVIFSDDLEMGAIAKHYPIEEACLKATAAGHDMLLICSNYQRQKQGFRSLVDAYDTGQLPAEEFERSVKRIKKVKKFCTMNTSLTAEDTSLQSDALARRIAEQSITIISDDTHLIPLNNKKTNQLLMLIPDLSPLPVREKGYDPTEHHFLIKECARSFIGTRTFHFFPLNPGKREIDQIKKLVNRHHLCLAFISNAQGNEGQRLLIKELQKLKNDIIFALMDNPFDYEFLSTHTTCITSYGLRKIQLISLLKIIAGKAKATGTLPFEKR